MGNKKHYIRQATGEGYLEIVLKGSADCFSMAIVVIDGCHTLIHRPLQANVLRSTVSTISVHCQLTRARDLLQVISHAWL